jgi:tRNA (guanine-N7-)-methyltransferase
MGLVSPERLYGRIKGHRLRPRQEWLIETVLPRLAFSAVEDPGAAFAARPKEIWLEVGFGGGEHAAALAAEHPAVGLIACEVFEPGICSLLSRLVPDDEASLPGNLRLWTDDARSLLQALPDMCLDRLFLMFPDPWPKARHAKRRFVHPERLAMVHRVLRPGGIWRIASDDPTYQAWVNDVFFRQSLFDVAEPKTTRPEGWPPTRYEAKAINAGRTPVYWEVERRKG